MNTYMLPCLDTIDWSKCVAQPVSQCVWSSNAAPVAHYAAWNKVETESPDFYRPEYFGKIIID